MKLFVIALHIEARPLIKKLGLKKDPKSKKLPIYRTSDCALIISGPGPLSAAIATTQLLAAMDEQAMDKIHCFNIGICGCRSRTIKTGTLFLINKITQTSTGRSHYPDILAKHALPEHSIKTVDKPVSRNDTIASETSDDFFDMEAAGFFKAASMYVAPHQIHCLKIVSDHLEGDLLEKKTVSGIIESACPGIETYLEATDAIPAIENPVLSPSEQSLLTQLTQSLRLTQTQFHQLNDAMLASSLRGNTERNNSLSHYLAQAPRHKTERDQLLKQLLATLRDDQ